MKKEEILAMTNEQIFAIAAAAADARRERNNREDELKIARRAAEKIAAGERITVQEFEALTGIMFSHHMSGKMENILALSSCCLYNPVCIARMRAGIGICAECFAVAIELQRSGVLENTCYNTEVLSASVLPLETLPMIDADELRMEPFGDSKNWKHAANYFNIARVNPLVPVTIWTKNPGHYHEAIQRGYSKPSNVTLIFSSLELNTPQEIPEAYEAIIDKRFTVYTLDWLDRNGLDHGFINCGGRSCKSCQRCYKRAGKTEFDVRELLKKDADKAARTRGGNWADWSDTKKEAETETTPATIKEILAMFGK